MKVALYTAPTSECLSLGELKEHVKYDGGTFSDNVDSTQSIAPGVHVVADNYTTHVGASKEVLGYSAIVFLESGTNGATGTVDVKIQESDNNSTWTDWIGGAFAQVTTANDNATYEKEYTGTKRYIRTVAKVLVANCEFGTSILRNDVWVMEDDLLSAILTASREHVEDITRRQIMTAIWDYHLDHWPCSDLFGIGGHHESRFTGNFLSSRRFTDMTAIQLPFGNLQTVTHVKYKDTAGTEYTLVEDTDYIVETNGDQCGRLVLPFGHIWPATVLYTSNPISIRFTCGWTSAALVPSKIKTAIKMIAADLYDNRSKQIEATSRFVIAENTTVDLILNSARLWGVF